MAHPERHLTLIGQLEGTVDSAGGSVELTKDVGNMWGIGELVEGEALSPVSVKGLVSSPKR